MKKFLMIVLMLVFTVPALAENTILIVGDSISAGYGIDPTAGWVNLLSQRLKDSKYDYRVVNASISGDTLSNGLSRMPAALTTYQPVITIIELGGNDGLHGLAPDLIKKNLASLIALAKNAGSKVLVLGMRIPPNYGAAYTAQFQAVYQDLANQGDVSGVDSNPKLMQGDGLHPAASAQQMLLDNMWPTLKALLNQG